MIVLAIVVKATVLLAGAAILETSLRHRGSAAARHMVWVAAMAGLLVLPVASAELPRWTVRIPVERETAFAATQSSVMPRKGPATGSVAKEAVAVRAPDRPGAPTRFPSALAIVIAVYVAGVVVLLARLRFEQVALLRLARTSCVLSSPGWRQLLDTASRELGISRHVTLIQVNTELMPLTFGVRRPTVVLPASADAWSVDRRRAVLLHELAHVARHDCLTQMVAAVACAVYWPHPGAWWGARRLRIERELACDDRVLAAGTEPRVYAGHLLEIAHSLGRTPAPAVALGMARAGQLESRLLAVLDAARNRAALSRRGGYISIVALAVVSLPMAALHAAIVPTARAVTPGPIALGSAFGAQAQGPTSASATTGTWEVRSTDNPGVVQVTFRTAHGTHSNTVPVDRVEAVAGQRIPATGPVHFTIQREAGTFTGDGNCRGGVCGGTFGFTPDAAFATELARRGLGKPTAEEQLALAAADVNMAYLDGLTGAGYKPADVHTLARAAQHGISLAYVQGMAGLGYRVGTLEELIRMRDHGVDPEFVRGLAANGLSRLPPEDLVRARDHGVDPEYVRGMEAHGYMGSTEDLIRMRDHGVDPEYASAMASLGYKNVPSNELVRSRDHGVDPEYVRGLAELGYKGLSLDELIRMRDHGVDPDFVRRVQQKGLGHLSVDELIRRRDRGTDDPDAAAREMLVSLQSFWRSFRTWLRG